MDRRPKEWVVAAVVLAGLVGWTKYGPNSHSADPLKSMSDGATYSDKPLLNVGYNAAVVEGAVKALLRDPASAVFRNVTVNGDRKLNGRYSGVACGYVNSKDGSGAYTGEKQFVYLMAGSIVSVDPAPGDNHKFAKLWQDLCAGSHN